MSRLYVVFGLSEMICQKVQWRSEQRH